MNVTGRKFVEKHINDLIEFRNIEEVKNYFKNNKIDINDAEIESLKEAIKLSFKDVGNQATLSYEDLANISGGDNDSGMSLTTAQIIAGCLTIGLFVAGAATGVIGMATGSALGNFTGLLSMGGMSVGQLFGQGVIAIGQRNEVDKAIKQNATYYTGVTNDNNSCG